MYEEHASKVIHLENKINKYEDEARKLISENSDNRMKIKILEGEKQFYKTECEAIDNEVLNSKKDRESYLQEFRNLK